MQADNTPEPPPPGQDVQQSRIERGASALGLDGPLGVVEQVVVNRDTGELSSLVVRSASGQEFELPADRIERATGDKVFLALSQAEMVAHPELVQPYTPELYTPVDEGVAVPPGQVVQLGTEAPVVTEVEFDAVELATPVQAIDARNEAQANAPAPSLPDQGTIVNIAGEPKLAVGPEPSAAGDLGPAEEPIAAEELIMTIPPGALGGLSEEPGVPSPLETGSQDIGNVVVIAGLTVAGMLLGSAAAAGAYLLVRRRQRATLPVTARQRLGDLRSAVSAAPATAARRLPLLKRRSWRPSLGPTLGSTFGLLGLRLAREADDLLDTLRHQARRTAGTVRDVVPSPRNLGGVLATNTAEITAGGRRLGSQLTHLAQQTASNLTSRIRGTGKATAATAGAQAARVGVRATQTRRRMARRTRSFARRARWFRRGLVAGFVCGLLLAPEPGQAVRARLAAALRRLPRLSGRLGGAVTSAVGATGPHPPTQPLGSAPLSPTSPQSAAGVDTPLLQPMSEEPLLPPPPEDIGGELPSSTGL